MSWKFYCAIILTCIFLSQGCFSSRHEIEVKPIEIKPMTININVKIEEELKKEFGKADKMAKKISDEEAEEALKKYMEKNNTEKED